jgi:hypothetical protein
MTTLKSNDQARDMKRELRQLRQTARKIAATKESARRFLVSTGIYSANGQLKPQFR